MIPKLIHYSWFSNDEMPLAYKQMVDTWGNVLPDYEIRLWDAEALKSANMRFANEAYSVKKMGFCRRCNQKLCFVPLWRHMVGCRCCHV